MLHDAGEPLGSTFLDEAALAHPADLDGLSLLDYHGHGPVATGELEHPLVSITVFFNVVLHEVHSAPFEIFASGRAVGASRRGVEFYWHISILANHRSGVWDEVLRQADGINGAIASKHAVSGL